MGSKMSSTKSSVMGYAPQNHFALHGRQPTESDVSTPQNLKEKAFINSEKSKEEMTQLSKKLNDIKRESDVVKIEDSYNTVSAKFSSHMGHTDGSSQHFVQNKQPANLIDYTQKHQNFVYEKDPEELKQDEKERSVTFRPKKEQNPEPRADTQHAHTPLNRISEEVGQSKETVTSRSNKSQKKSEGNSEKKSPKKPDLDLTPQNLNSEFVTFDVDNRQHSARFSPEKAEERANSHKQGKSMTARNKGRDKSREVKKQQKLQQKKQLEQKLKELEELERMVQEKERVKKRRRRAAITIQRWVRGHLARRSYELLKRDACYLRKLRRILSVCITRVQSKFVNSVILALNKAGAEKLKNMHHHRNKLRKAKSVKGNQAMGRDRSPEFISRKQKSFKNPYKDHFSLGVNPYIRDKIIAFVRGWKIRKIMKCREVITLIKSLNDVSISIKMSQRHPHNRNFIRDYMNQKKQTVEQFLFVLKKLYYTGDWTKSYKPIGSENSESERPAFNPKLVVNLSVPINERHDMLASTKTEKPPLMHLNSVSSQMMPLYPQRTPMKISPGKDINWNSPSYRSPQHKLHGSPFKPMNFNPVNNYPGPGGRMFPPNQRYAIPPHLVNSISDPRTSDIEAMNLISQVLGGGSPNSSRPSTFHGQVEARNPKPGVHESHNPSQTPVVPEFQQPAKNAVRETLEMPSQNMASITTFTPVNVDEMPAQSQKEQKMQAQGRNPPYESPQDKRQELKMPPDHHPESHKSRNSGSPAQPTGELSSSMASIKVPEYNFEEILQKAIEEQGEDAVKESTNATENSPKKKPKFLKKKKRYDPREAIRKEKKKKKQNKGNNTMF